MTFFQLAMSFLKLMFPLTSQYLQENNSQTSESVKSVLSQTLEQLDSEECSKVVIVGPDRADKTSLVFQAAISAAASGIQTVHICTHPLKRLPILVHGLMTPEPNIMKNLNFLYFEEAGELIAWFAGLHTRTNLPSLIIIEDILTYAAQLSEQHLDKSLARLCAIIVDGMAWIRSHGDMKICQVLMTAPTRMTSLDSVLSQFDFRCAIYHGPGKDDPNSQLTYESDSCSMTITFNRIKDTIRVIDVQTSRTKKS